MRSQSHLPVLLAVVAAALAGLAQAQAQVSCASFDDCVALMKARNQAEDYPAAQRAAEAAYALSPDPDLLSNLGRFHRKQGHVREALDYYQRYLDSHAPSLTPEVRAEVEETMNKLRQPPPPGELPAPEPHAQPISTPPPALVVTQAAPPRRLSWRSLTGIPAMAVGVGLLSFGGYALARDGQCADAGSPCDMRYDSRTEGLATVAPGAALLATGVTLLTIDLVRLRRVR